MAKATTGECLARLPNVPHYHRFAKSGLAESGKRCILVAATTTNPICAASLIKYVFRRAQPDMPLFSTPENATLKLRCVKNRAAGGFSERRGQLAEAAPVAHSLLGATTGADATANVSPQLPVRRLGDSIVDPTSPLHPSSAVFPRVSRDHC